MMRGGEHWGAAGKELGGTLGDASRLVRAGRQGRMTARATLCHVYEYTLEHVDLALGLSTLCTLSDVDQPD